MLFNQFLVLFFSELKLLRKLFPFLIRLFKFLLSLLTFFLRLLESAFHLLFSFLRFCIVKRQLSNAFTLDNQLLAVFDQELHLSVVLFIFLLDLRQLGLVVGAVLKSLVFKRFTFLEKFGEVLCVVLDGDVENFAALSLGG